MARPSSRACAASIPALEIEAINTKGSTENVPMLEAGTLDIALVQGEVVHEALSGIGRPPADLKIITAMYPTAGMFVVRADQPYRSIADLKGKPIAWGAQGSGLVILGRYAMDGLGLDAAKDFQPVYLERAGDGPAMVLDGRVAALWGGGTGWPGFTAVAKSEKGARFIAPDAEEIARILAKHSFLKPVTQAAGSFPGQDAAIPSVGSWSFVMARPALDDAVAYRLAKALHDRKKPAARRRNWSTPRRKHAGGRAARAPASRCRTLFPGGRPHRGPCNFVWADAFLGLATKERSMDDKQKKDSKIEGEGSYSGTRAYNEATAKFLKKGKVDEAAQEAKRALESKEGAELKAAEAKGKAGDPTIGRRLAAERARMAAGRMGRIADRHVNAVAS